MRLPRRFAPRSDKLVLHFLFAIANHSFSFVIASLPKAGVAITFTYSRTLFFLPLTSSHIFIFAFAFC
jgi:hypothetical protein